MHDTCSKNIHYDDPFKDLVQCTIYIHRREETNWWAERSRTKLTFLLPLTLAGTCLSSLLHCILSCHMSCDIPSSIILFPVKKRQSYHCTQWNYLKFFLIKSVQIFILYQKNIIRFTWNILFILYLLIIINIATIFVLLLKPQYCT
jgi:hypothetical protein